MRTAGAPLKAAPAAGMAPMADLRERSSLADRATEMVRDRILDLTLPPGMRLDEKSLIETFAVGRTPIREALNRLMSEGLIEARGTRGFVVAPMNLENAMQLLDAYALSERMVAARVRFDHPDLLATLRAVDAGYERFTAAGDILNVTAQNAEFHAVLAAATGNVHIEQFSQHLHSLARRLSYYVYRAEKSQSDGHARLFDRTTEDHRRIIEAIRDEDRDRLVEVMTRHAGLFRERLSRLMEGAMRREVTFETV